MITLALVCLLGPCILLVQLLHWYCLRSEDKAPGWIKQWEFRPSDEGGSSYGRLLVVSFLSLFLELLMIRWVSSEVRVFAYLKNYVLMACFLGLGLGCYLSRRAINLMAFILPLVYLTFCVASPWAAMRDLMALLPEMLSVGSNVQVWGVPAINLTRSSVPALMLGVSITAVLFFVIAFIFVPIGQLVGWYVENARNGIAGYSLNLLGSLLGTLVYAALCFRYEAPPVWFAVAIVPVLALLRKRWRIAAVTVAGLIVCAVWSAPRPGPNTGIYWSPYQKLSLTARPSESAPENYQLMTNGSWYQQIVNLSPEYVSRHPWLFPPGALAANPYNLPYRFQGSAHNVLVLGAGMGNDVAAALRDTNANITAVEIDPLIVQLGRKLHFEKPYSSPRVKVIVDDARNYIQTSTSRFDLIVFSLLDSHTTSSSYTNIRIDNYVYTIEALTAARNLLTADGVFVVKFQSSTPWIAGRLEQSLRSVFHQAPLLFVSEGDKQGTGGSFFINGSEDRIRHAMADPFLAKLADASRSFPTVPAPITTDDWPYFYQEAPGLPLNVILISALLIIMCRALLRKQIVGSSSGNWHFFFLGAGFMLLEAQIISKMALLFGTTWVVNCIVISGLLLLMIFGNVAVQQWPHTPYAVGYAGIFASLLLAWSIPLHAYFFDSTLLKISLATLGLCTPVFFAAFVFIRSFARVRFSGAALGSNLFGALVGGLLESMSLWTGLRSLLVVAAVLYFASLLAIRALRGVDGAGQRSTTATTQSAAASTTT